MWYLIHVIRRNVRRRWRKNTLENMYLTRGHQKVRSFEISPGNTQKVLDIAGKLRGSSGVKLGRMEHKWLVSPDLEDSGLQLRAEPVL